MHIWNITSIWFYHLYDIQASGSFHASWRISYWGGSLFNILKWIMGCLQKAWTWSAGVWGITCGMCISSLFKWHISIYEVSPCRLLSFHPEYFFWGSSFYHKNLTWFSWSCQIRLLAGPFLRLSPLQFFMYVYYLSFNAWMQDSVLSGIRFLRMKIALWRMMQVLGCCQTTMLLPYEKV